MSFFQPRSSLSHKIISSSVFVLQLIQKSIKKKVLTIFLIHLNSDIQIFLVSYDMSPGLVKKTLLIWLKKIKKIQTISDQSIQD